MKKAFTLVELLIVITIIGVLAVALLPRLTGGRDKARDAARIAAIQQLNTSFEFLVDDYMQGLYPGGGNDGDDEPVCISREDIVFQLGTHLSTVPIEKIPNHRWAGSECDGTIELVGEFETPVQNPTEGYDYIPTATGFLMVAKLENPDATGELIFDEDSLLTQYQRTDLIIFDRPTTDILGDLTRCTSPGDCTSTVVILAR